MTLSANANAGAFLLFIVAFILAVSNTSYAALNITKALEKQPEYSTLNELFKETKLTGAINKRQTITILALDNDSIKLIANRSSDELRKILMNHIILDYYDKQKIKKMEKKSILLTTLYQTTGSANDKEGFVNITKIKTGEVVFGSGVKKTPLVSKLLGSVITQPFNLSVLHVSLPIVAPSFGEAIEAPPPPPGDSSNSSSGVKKKSKSGEADAPSPSDDEEGEEEEADSPSPSDAPAEAPEEDKAKSPAKKKDAAADEDNKESASSTVVWSRVGIAAAIGLVTTLVAF